MCGRQGWQRITSKVYLIANDKPASIKKASHDAPTVLEAR